MAIADDLDAFFAAPMGVSATSGSTTGRGILSQPTEVEIGGQVLFVDYVFRCKTSDFGSLVAKDAIVIDSVNYTVREAAKDADGLTTILSVQKT